MSINDNGIVDTLKECPENGFRMLMMKYQEPVYWHIRRLVVSHDDAQDASQISPLIQEKKITFYIQIYANDDWCRSARQSSFLSHIVISIIFS